MVVGAASVDEILASLGDAGRYPDLIIADYRLAAGELGTHVIERLRDEFGVMIPALLVSGDASAEAIMAIRTSRLDVLLKPVVPWLLRDTAERLLGSTRISPAPSQPFPIEGEGIKRHPHPNLPPSRGKEYQKKAPREGAPEDRPSSG
jgi:DNA-binding NtrC family response regulator